MKYLNQLATIYWTRPENALWLTRVMQVLDEVVFEEPVLDLMCGHGMWSFVRAGGQFGSGFDVHQVTKDLARYHEGVDIQNHFSENYAPEITKRPNYRIACGLDWKDANLKKCEKLEFYDRLVQADCNERLPFEDCTFKTVFCNTIYWVDDIEHILSEVNRILRPDGRAVLINYLPEINDYLKIYQGRTSAKWLKLIDRNRSNENKHIFSKEKWEELYNSACMETVEYIPTVNKLFAHIWNIGLRPFSGYLMQMADNMAKDDLRVLKEGWVDTMCTLMEPFLSHQDFVDIVPGQEAEAIFVLKKKSSRNLAA